MSRSSMSATRAVNSGLVTRRVISKFSRKERLSKLAVPTPASWSSITSTFWCMKPPP